MPCVEVQTQNVSESCTVLCCHLCAQQELEVAKMLQVSSQRTHAAVKSADVSLGGEEAETMPAVFNMTAPQLLSSHLEYSFRKQSHLLNFPNFASAGRKRIVRC